MQILVTADLHFSENPRDEYRHEFQRELRNIVKKHDVSRVIILGDLTEAKDRHSAELVNRIVDHFYKLTALCDVTFLRGNHDYLTSPDNPFFAFLSRIEHISWINNPTAIGTWLYLPHTTDYKNDWKQFKFSDFDTIFCHQTFEGADTGFKQLTGIPTSIFPKSVKVLSGDIHVPQDLGTVTYVGAPYTVDFGDNYEPRMLLLDSKDMISIPCPGPQKRYVERKRNSEFITEHKLNKGDILKVKADFEPGLALSWQQIKQEVKDWAEDKGYIVHSIQPIVTHKKMKKTQNKKAAQSDEDLLAAYGKARGINESVLKTGLWLMENS